jgi:hypothetical protein
MSRGSVRRAVPGVGVTHPLTQEAVGPPLGNVVVVVATVVVVVSSVVVVAAVVVVVVDSLVVVACAAVVVVSGEALVVVPSVVVVSWVASLHAATSRRATTRTVRMRIRCSSNGVSDSSIISTGGRQT